MTTSFQNTKKLRFTIVLTAGTFGNGGNTVTIQDFRATANVEKAGGQMMSAAKAQIWGLPQQMMNQLTTLSWKARSFNRNTMQIQAIDGDNVTTVYFGQIINAWPDYTAMPNVGMFFECQTGFLDQVIPIPPRSYKGAADVATIMNQIATGMGVAFENNGVSIALSNPYYPGTAIDQMRALAQAAGIDLYLDDKTLAICPKGVPRKTQGIPLISPSSGLNGYPTFDKIGIGFNTLFNPAILFGGQIQMESPLPPANGIWRVVAVNHSLSSEMPDGPWFSQVRCTEGNNAVIKR